MQSIGANLDECLEQIRKGVRLTFFSEYLDTNETTYFSRLSLPKQLFVIIINLNVLIGTLFLAEKIIYVHDELMDLVYRGKNLLEKRF